MGELRAPVQKSSPAVYSASGFSVIHHFAHPTRLFVTTSQPGSPRLRDETAERLDHDREMNERLIPREQRGHVVVVDLLGATRSEYAGAEEVDAAVSLSPLRGPVRGLPVVAPLAD
jgi:hypothetical protein